MVSVLLWLRLSMRDEGIALCFWIKVGTTVLRSHFCTRSLGISFCVPFTFRLPKLLWGDNRFGRNFYLFAGGSIPLVISSFWLLIQKSMNFLIYWKEEDTNFGMYFWRSSFPFFWTISRMSSTIFFSEWFRCFLEYSGSLSCFELLIHPITSKFWLRPIIVSETMKGPYFLNKVSNMLSTLSRMTKVSTGSINYWRCSLSEYENYWTKRNIPPCWSLRIMTLGVPGGV